MSSREESTELALLDPAPRDATITASTDVVVGVLGARAFNAIVRDVPGMNAKLLRALARRLRDADLKQPASVTAG